MKRVNILNLSIDNINQLELLEKIRWGGVLFTPNVDHIMKLQTNRDFYQAYLAANYRICDSQILLYASKFLGTPIQEKISGADFFRAFYEYYSNDEKMRIFLLGSVEGVAAKAQDQINNKVGRKIVVDTYSPSFNFENNQAECDKIINLINQSGATVLAVGVGAPKQEIWIHKHKKKLKNLKIFLAIGATIDFEAGHCQRAPLWMRNVGLEWFHRLISEPQRLWKRYLLEDLPFFWLLWKQKLKLYKMPFSESQVPNPLKSPGGNYLVSPEQRGNQGKSEPITLARSELKQPHSGSSPSRSSF